MTRWECAVCSYVYDESEGDESNSIPKGTLFEELPPHWSCPICGASKDFFKKLDEPVISKSSDKTVADVIMSELERWGIDTVFGLPGTSSLGLVDAVRKSANLRYIPVRHEANAAMAASAYNKLTGRIAVCMTIAGPGASNLATGLYDAKQDNASVLSLNGQVRFQYSGPGGAQEIDQDAFFRPICVFNNTIYDKKMTVRLVNMALKHAKVKRGVAQLSVPNNIQKEFLTSADEKHEICLDDLSIHPNEAMIEKAAALLDSAERPIILAGFGAHPYGEAVAELAKRIKAPIVTTWRAKGMLPDDHPLVLGIHGSVGPPQSMEELAAADLILSLGVGFSQKTSIPWGKRMIQVDIDPLKIGKYPYEVALWGNCAEIVPRLTAAVHGRDDTTCLERLALHKKNWRETLSKEAERKESPLWPPYIMKVLSDNLPEDAVISIDVGDNAWWFGRNFRMKKQRFVMSGYLATMGFGLPGAIAAKLAFPDKTVVCITGDGGFQMAMSDFVTAVTEDLPMVVVILNNKELAMIRQEQAVEGYPNFSTHLQNADFAHFAEDCGGRGIRVQNAEELLPALKTALESSVATIIDVDTDPRRFEGFH